MTCTITDIDAVREAHERRIEKAWRDVVTTRATAEETQRVEDGIEAGRAWRRWLDLFMSPDQRQQIEAAGNIITANFRAKSGNVSQSI